MHFEVHPSQAGNARLRVPGDKSVSHRALMLGAIAQGRTTVRGFLAGEDCLATLSALRALGVTIERVGDEGVAIEGVGLDGLRAPEAPLDLGNSGTAMRLFAGLLAGQAFDSELIGDRSLSSRPMQRVIVPLAAMGARIDSEDNRPPLRINGGRALRGISYALPIASAQVKSAVLLAGLYAEGETHVRQPAVTRDHTERMLAAMGARLTRQGNDVALSPGGVLHARDISVPADLSSATFPLLAALIARDSTLVLEGTGVNPTRDGALLILREMGAEIRLRNEREESGEPVADIEVRSSALRAGELDPTLVPLAIDEFPALFVAAACAEGETEFRGLAELRVKESDRIAAMVEGLRALGIEAEEHPDGAGIRGGKLRGGRVSSHGDHRIAMAFAVAASVADGPVRIDDVDNVATSFPGFDDCLRALGIDIRTVGEQGG